MREYGIGLDIGIASVGWATVALDDDENPMGIIDMGSRVFDAAEHPKTGASLAAPRREARSARRRLRRHRHRNQRIRRLIAESGILTEEELKELYSGQLRDVYELKVCALDEKLSRPEFARVLIHLSQRRGFKSNRKNASDKEEGKLLTAVSDNKKRMEEMGWRTAGEMLFKDEQFKEHRRNRGGEYFSTLSRDMIEDEVKKIFEAQRELGAEYASKDTEEKYLSILLSQRSFDEGPGGNSPYSGSINPGPCEFEAGELRAAKAAYSFEYFNLLQKINHIRIVGNGESLALNDGQRKKLIELSHKTAALNYARIRKELGIDDKLRFNTLRYEAEKSFEEIEKKEKFCYLKAYHEMKKAVEKNGKGRFEAISLEQRNAIGTALTLNKDEEKVRRKLREAGLEEIDVDALSGLNFTKCGHLSLKALDKIIPYLEKGMNYSDACKEAGYDFKAHNNEEKSFTLPAFKNENDEISSPVALRAISQTIKVVNAIIRKYEKSPMYINIELAREMSKSKLERNKLEKDMETRHKANENILERIKTEFGVQYPSGIDLVKLKLFEEQDGVCAYSLKKMSISRLFEPGYAEIDHIVPYSISFDDSYKNKVLVLTAENRNKGNRLPLQYLSGKRRDDFIVWVKNNVRNYKKRDLLLKETLDDEEQGFKERNLQDTRTISRFMLNYINDNLIFAPSAKGKKKKVKAVNGAVTDYMRKRWGIKKVKEDGDRHHAVDALVIACTTDGMIQKITKYSKYRECRYVQDESGSYVYSSKTGEVLDKFPYPWPHFRKELEARLGNNPSKLIAELRLPFYMEQDRPEVKPIFVSRMPNRKVTGAAHKDTVKSSKHLDEGYVLTKTALNKLKLKDGEIEDYFSPDSDRLLYNALKERLSEFGGDGEKAFAEPFRKPKKDGSPGPVVKTVKLMEKSTNPVPVQGHTAVADNESMVRVDVFKVEGEGYYLVPIYVADTLNKELPNKACVNIPKDFKGNRYEKWKEMREEDFQFSLYSNDLIRVTHKKLLKLTKANKKSSLPGSYEVKSEMLYYKGTNVSSGAIEVINNDNSYTIESLGTKTLKSIEKYTVDILGNYYPVRKETRQNFNIGGK